MIRQETLFHIRGLADVDLYFEHLEAVNYEIAAYQKVAELIGEATTINLLSEVDIVVYEQKLTYALTNFRNCLNFRLHYALVMNQRIALQRAEKENVI